MRRGSNVSNSIRYDQRSREAERKQRWEELEQLAADSKVVEFWTRYADLWNGRT